METGFNLDQAQDMAWLHQQPTPSTAREALGRLRETVGQCAADLEASRIIQVQSRLEDSLIQVLVAMKTLDMRPEAALRRAIERLQRATEKRVFHIFADRVEIRVLDERRGHWPLYSQGDYEAALQLARELGCDVVHEEAAQLELFGDARSRSTHPAQ